MEIKMIVSIVVSLIIAGGLFSLISSKGQGENGASTRKELGSMDGVWWDATDLAVCFSGYFGCGERGRFRYFAAPYRHCSCWV